MDESSNKYHDHDTHAIPPQAICNVYKKYQRATDHEVDKDLDIIDFRRGLTEVQKGKLVQIGVVQSELIAKAQYAYKFHGKENPQGLPNSDPLPNPCTIYEHQDFPGLRIYTSLLPPECQVMMMDSIMHRDLANPLHKTNLHADYNIPFPSSTSPTGSFFGYPPHSKHEVYTPLDSGSHHKQLNTTQFLSKKLRWLTLGSQYDWPTRSYPTTSPTPFPPDIASLVENLFQSSFTPESGVCLLYSTKDFMPVHRDVSEQCDRGLASFSLGCDGLFILSKEMNEKGEEANESNEDREMKICVLRVRSGDCVWMSGQTRWCWHAMPKVMNDTCPSWLENWPAKEGGRKEFEKWKGYMKGKRLNVSCRQVWG
ncbi:related to alkylated dna repair protein alkb homolog [Rhynchosporium agropyri]|uniref:mRNA N(6)-methyladenine demethylase n=1 Tax=Rhynchosporium agropyri TaxID=914238 RepID=A0A1E1LNU0_9HELO|nr:related to alkylated dna repair protein alkb homolog [Rhynchosporium agropyri]